mgnify:CR=1 FL=1
MSLAAARIELAYDKNPSPERVSSPGFSQMAGWATCSLAGQ